MQTIICQNCGKTFEAGENIERAFCVYCGAANTIEKDGSSGQVELPDLEGMSEQDRERYRKCREQFESVRFKVFNHKTGEKGDTLIGFWSTLMFHGRNSRGFFGIKRARKEVDKFWQHPVIAQAIADAGSLADRLISEQLYDSIKIFFKTCREDRHYGSKLLDMMKLKPEQIADKAAADVCGLIYQYWLTLEPIRYRDQIFRAAWHAFPISFPDKPDALRERVNAMSDEEYKELRHILLI